jgi:hypothetical protein
VAVFGDLGQRLVPEDDPVGSLGSDTELSLRDLAVGAAHADLEHTQPDAVAGGLADVLDAGGVRNAGLDDQGSQR